MAHSRRCQDTSPPRPLLRARVLDCQILYARRVLRLFVNTIYVHELVRTLLGVPFRLLALRLIFMRILNTVLHCE